MLELLKAPCLASDGGIELLEFILASEVLHIVPTALGMLHLHDDTGNLTGLFVVVLVSRSVIGIDHEMTHRGGTGRLQPNHRAVGGLQFAPLATAIGQITPDEGSLIADAVHHELGSTAHGSLGVLDVEVAILEIAERSRTGAGAEDAGKNRLELIERVVVVARAVHAPRLAFPCDAIIAVTARDDVVIVAQTEPYVTRTCLGMTASSTHAALAEAQTTIGIETGAHVEDTVVVEHKAGAGLVIAKFDLSLNLVAMFACNEHQRRGVTRQRSLALETNTTLDGGNTLRLVGTIGLPFETHAELAQLVT